MVVREDSLTIFGFVDEDEKQVFELVQTASGVGPKVAQAITAVLAPDDLRRAIASDDVKTLTRVPGIGQKGAQRIILELKDRIGAPRRGPARTPRRPARPGASRSTRASSDSAGRCATPSGPWTPSPTRPAAPPTSRRCCAPRSRRCRRPEPAMHEDELIEAETAHLLAREVSLTAAEADGDERVVEAALRPRSLDEVVGQTRVRAQLGLVLEAARRRERPAGPRAALRSARPRQDDARDDHRRRDERPAAAHQRPGHHARRRPGRDPVRAQPRRRAVRRRDPPDVPAGRGDALPRDGGLPGRRHRSARGRAPPRSRSTSRRSRWSARPLAPACCPARCATGSASPGTSSSTRPPSWT